MIFRIICFYTAAQNPIHPFHFFIIRQSPARITFEKYTFNTITLTALATYSSFNYHRISLQSNMPSFNSF